jgi:peptidoglycan/xylan/chitin deacetylase (PgdA/CDA1 family)
MSVYSPSGRVKYAIKWTIAHALYGLGVLHVWKALALRRRAIVLAYHRVLPSQDMSDTWSHPAIVVSTETFERHMRLLSRSFTPLNLTRFQDHLRDGTPFQPASCLVTFDDGWLDTYTEAWPILQRHRVPAVVFLPVALIGSDAIFWQERLGQLAFAAWQRARQDAAFAAAARKVLQPWGVQGILDLDGDNVREEVIARVRTIKSTHDTQPGALIEALVALLGSAAPAKPDGERFMQWDHVREMSRDGVTFGGHGETHRILTTLSSDDLRREMSESQAALTREVGRPAASLSYPNGNWNPAVAGAARAGGFEIGFSMERGVVTSGDDRYSVKRVNVHEAIGRSTPLFLARILGLL